MKTLIIYSLIIFGFLASSCTKDKSEQKEQIEVQEEHGEAIELTKEQMEAVGIEIGTIEQKNLREIVRASGTLAVPPQNQADISVLIGGAVKQIFVLEGSYVKKGATLMTIENPELLKMQQDYLTASSSFNYLEKEYQRQKELNERNAGTGKVFQQTESNYIAERAKVQSLGKQLMQLNINLKELNEGNIATQIPITAPINGVVAHIAVNLGTFAETGKVLMDIVDNSQIHCDLQIYEKDLFKVKKGQKVNFMLTNQNNRQIQGEIYGINQSFEGESKAVLAHAVVSKTAGLNLFPGMYVSASIDVGGQTLMAIPVDAVVKSEGKNYIFVVVEEVNEKKSAEDHIQFVKTEVVTGTSDLGYIEITPLEKLREGTKVVTKGAFYVLSKSQGSAEEE